MWHEICHFELSNSLSQQSMPLCPACKFCPTPFSCTGVLAMIPQITLTSPFKDVATKEKSGNCFEFSKYWLKIIFSPYSSFFVCLSRYKTVSNIKGPDVENQSGKQMNMHPSVRPSVVRFCQNLLVYC